MNRFTKSHILWHCQISFHQGSEISLSCVTYACLLRGWALPPQRGKSKATFSKGGFFTPLEVGWHVILQTFSLWCTHHSTSIIQLYKPNPAMLGAIRVIEFCAWHLARHSKIWQASILHVEGVSSFTRIRPYFPESVLTESINPLDKTTLDSLTPEVRCMSTKNDSFFPWWQS